VAVRGEGGHSTCEDGKSIKKRTRKSWVGRNERVLQKKGKVSIKTLSKWVTVVAYGSPTKVRKA